MKPLIDFVFHVVTSYPCKQGVRALLKKMASLSMKGDSSSVEYLAQLMYKLSNAFEENTPRGIFSFNNSSKLGITLTNCTLPMQGYGFFGWLNIETFIEQMCVWQFSDLYGKRIELSIENRKLFYKSSMENDKVVQFLLLENLEVNTWYFVELYQIKDKSSCNLVSIQQQPQCAYINEKEYLNSTITCNEKVCLFTKNSIGFKYILDEPCNKFIGKMSSLYFMHINKGTIGTIHACVNKLRKLSDISNLMLFPEHKEALYMNFPKLQETVPFNDLVQIFNVIIVFINSHFATYDLKPNESVYFSDLPIVKKNYISSFNGTVVYKTIPVMETFGLIKGPLSLFPILEKTQVAAILETFLSIITDFVRTNIQEATVFLDKDNGIVILGYFLERWVKAIEFSTRVAESSIGLMKVIKKYYPTLFPKYNEEIMHNPDIWIFSNDKLYMLILNRIYDGYMIDKCEKKEHHFGVLLNFLETLCNCEPLSEIRMKNLEGIICSTYDEKVTKKILNLLLSYINSYTIKNKKNCFIQIHCILSIFLHFYDLSNSFQTKQMLQRLIALSRRKQRRRRTQKSFPQYTPPLTTL